MMMFMMTYVLIGLGVIASDVILMLIAGVKARALLLDFTYWVWSIARVLIWPVSVIYSLIKTIQICKLIHKGMEL